MPFTEGAAEELFWEAAEPDSPTPAKHFAVFIHLLLILYPSAPKLYLSELQIQKQMETWI